MAKLGNIVADAKVGSVNWIYFHLIQRYFLLRVAKLGNRYFRAHRSMCPASSPRPTILPLSGLRRMKLNRSVCFWCLRQLPKNCYQISRLKPVIYVKWSLLDINTTTHGGKTKTFKIYKLIKQTSFPSLPADLASDATFNLFFYSIGKITGAGLKIDSTIHVNLPEKQPCKSRCSVLAHLSSIQIFALWRTKCVFVTCVGIFVSYQSPTGSVKSISMICGSVYSWPVRFLSQRHSAIRAFEGSR